MAYTTQLGKHKIFLRKDFFFQRPISDGHRWQQGQAEASCKSWQGQGWSERGRRGKKTALVKPDVLGGGAGGAVAGEDYLGEGSVVFPRRRRPDSRRTPLPSVNKGDGGPWATPAPTALGEMGEEELVS